MTARAGSTRLRWGGATDVGRVRSNNQDQYVARDDVERRSALVSNLIVVLCSERDTQPIVNTGAGAR